MTAIEETKRSPRLPREVWILVGAAFLVAVGFGLVAPALPTFARTFDVGVTAASALISAFAVFRLVFAPMSGRLVNTMGERWVFLVGLTVVAVSTGACAIAQSYWQLLVFRAVGGIGSTMFTVSAMSLLMRITPPEGRGRASGMWATGFLLGNVTGPLFGGGLVAISLRAPFVVYALALVVTVLATGVLLRRSMLSGRPDQSREPSVTVRSALRNPSFRAALAGSFANGWAVFGVRMALIPLFVVEVLREQASWAGIALTAFAAGNAVTLTLSGRWSDRRGRKPPLLLGLFVTGLAMVVLGFTGSLPTFLAASLVGGVGTGLMTPPLNASVADVVGANGRGGPVFASFQMMADLGAIIGPIAAGAVVEAASYGWAFALAGVVPLLAFLVWLRTPDTLPRRAAG